MVDATEGQEIEFSIQKIYLKDVSFESPQSPDIFRKDWNPDVNLELSTKTKAISEGIYEVVIDATATVTMNKEVVFLVEAQQAGIFGISKIPQEQLGPMLGSYCPSILFPYLREAISDIVTKGGFPQLLLAPVNFDNLYAQHLEKQSQEEQAKTGESKSN
tara:strand:- start:893 stop:1372 length:480 start_codon:yes stop_codon:yes gene_type:complete